MTSAASSGCSTCTPRSARTATGRGPTPPTFLQGAYGDLEPEKLQRIAPSGTPEEVAERVQEYVDAGVRHVIVSPAAPSDTLEVVRLAAEEVLPRLALPVPAR